MNSSRKKICFFVSFGVAVAIFCAVGHILGAKWAWDKETLTLSYQVTR